jgi:hypothetical protein
VIAVPLLLVYALLASFLLCFLYPHACLFFFFFFPPDPCRESPWNAPS